MNKSTKAVPMSRVNIRTATNSLKRRFNIPCDEPFPIVEFVEWILSELGLNLEILPDEDMDKVYAEAIPEKGILRIRESTYEGACDGNPRDKFTVAHEIGHLLLHTSERIIFTRASNKIKSYECPEWQANTFAGELLVHADFIRGLSVDDIANRYEVSYTVATIQKEKS